MMKSTDYPIFLVYSKEDEGWLARVDVLGGCVADGKTPEEALANVKEEIQLWVETSKELGRPIPKALDAQEIEDLQIDLAAQQGQKIQQLIQQGVQQILDQTLSQLTKERYGYRGVYPSSARLNDFTVV